MDYASTIELICDLLERHQCSPGSGCICADIRAQEIVARELEKRKREFETAKGSPSAGA